MIPSNPTCVTNFHTHRFPRFPVTSFRPNHGPCYRVRYDSVHPSPRLGWWKRGSRFVTYLIQGTTPRDHCSRVGSGHPEYHRRYCVFSHQSDGRRKNCRSECDEGRHTFHCSDPRPIRSFTGRPLPGPWVRGVERPVPPKFVFIIDTGVVVEV